MDESFGDLAKLLQFRDKEQERVEKYEKKKKGELSPDDLEMDAWDKEMKVCCLLPTTCHIFCCLCFVYLYMHGLTKSISQGYLFERKVKAADRTKTPEEIAKEEADRLHELETRRLARMHGDFDKDDLSDISDDEIGTKRGKRGTKADKKNRKRDRGLNPEELSDSDDEKGGDNEVQFTADGLVYLDRDGKVVGKVGEEQGSSNEQVDDDESQSSEDEGSAGDDLGNSDDEASAASSSEGESDDEYIAPTQLTEGSKVQGNYHASEQYGGKENWYNGVITAVRSDSQGNTIYDVTYDDGDFEEGMIEMNVRALPKTKEESEENNARVSEAAMVKKKKLKAKIRAK